MKVTFTNQQQKKVHFAFSSARNSIFLFFWATTSGNKQYEISQGLKPKIKKHTQIYNERFYHVPHRKTTSSKLLCCSF